MGKSNYALNAPQSILEAARRAAKRDGVSLNQFISTALAENVAALEAGEVFTWRAARADKARFLEVLERLGGEAPRPGDELDAGDERSRVAHPRAGAPVAPVCQDHREGRAEGGASTN